MIFSTDTATISYDIIRGEMRDDRTPLLFLHSALGTRREFDRLQEYYPDRTLILPDFPSHGESTTSLNSITIRDFAMWIRVLLSEGLKIPVVDIIGYSMGGYVAIEMALAEPRLVRSVVSHAMKFYWTDAAVSEAIVGLTPSTIKARSEKAFASLSEMHAPNGMQRTTKLATTVIEGFGKYQLRPVDLEHLECPLLLSVGDSDGMVPPEEVTMLYQVLSRSKTYLAIHPNSPHAISKLDLGSFTNAARTVLA
jgi:pimeloyl-ACP methyl ester carboxylesterase